MQTTTDSLQRIKWSFRVTLNAQVETSIFHENSLFSSDYVYVYHCCKWQHGKPSVETIWQRKKKKSSSSSKKKGNENKKLSQECNK